MSFNPLLDPSDPVGRDVARLVHAGLVRVTDGGDIAPDLAERWITEDGGTSYVFFLRPKAAWHDGRPIIAADVVSTIRIVQAPDFPGPRELALLWKRVTPEIVDEHTVRLRLNAPYSTFIEACSLPLLPAHLFRPEDAARLADIDASYRPVGAGPYRVVEETELGVRLQRHDGYQGGKPYLDEVAFRYYPDGASAAAALRSGEVDGLAADSSVLSAPTPGAVTVTVPLQGRQVILFLNQQNPILADARVRQAIARGLDREGLLREVAGSDGVPAYGPIPSFSWAYSPVVETSPDLAGAGARLSEAGWGGNGTRTQAGQSLTLQLLTPMDRRLAGFGEGIKSQLAALGMRVEVQPTDLLDLYRERLAARRFDMALLMVELPSLDPDPAILWSASENASFRFAPFQQTEAERLMEEVRSNGDPTARLAALEAFQARWLQDVPSVVLVSPTLTYAISTRVHGIQPGVVPEPSARLQHVPQWYLYTERVPALFSALGR
jgi:peptide/nickel transport system substrate-binding protein